MTSYLETSRSGTSRAASALLFLPLILPVLRDILQTAVQDLAQPVHGIGTDVPVFPQPIQLSVADVISLNELIL